MIKKLLIFLLLLPVCSAAQVPSTYVPQLITYQGVPFGVCSVYQIAENVTNGNYYTCNISTHTWTLMAGGGGFSTPCSTSAAGLVPITPGDSTKFLNGLTCSWTVPPNSGSIDCSTFAGADVGAKWNACIAASPSGSVLTFKNFTSPQVMTTAVNVNKNVWNDMAGLQITQQAAITISTIAVIARGEFDQAFNGDQITISADGTLLYNNTIIGNDGVNTGRGVVISSGTNVILDTNAIEFHNGNEIEDNGGSSFAPNTIQNSTIFFDGGAGVSSTGGDNIISTQFNWGSLGAGHAILQPSTSFLSLIRVDNSTFNGSQAASMIYAPNAAAFTMTNSKITVAGGYPAIDAPNGGTIVISQNSILGGGVNGPTLRIATTSFGGQEIDISHNYLISAQPGANAIEAALSQGAKIDDNDLVTAAYSGTGGCVIKITAALGGSVSNNGISVVGYSSFTGPNYGFCYVPTAGQHSDNLHIFHNTITGQSSVDTTKSVGMLWDNSANVVTDFADYNVWDTNFCIDLGTCITRVSPTQNNINTYSNNGGVALAQVYDATGSTNDQVLNFNTSFANLPVAGSRSWGYCTDCSSASAGGGTGLVLFKVNGVWTFSTALLSQIQPGTNSIAGTFAFSGNTVDLHAASHTLSTSRGTVGSIPATCTIGELYFATDATAGQNIYECQSTNVWTQQLNSGAAGASTSLGNLAAVAINASLVPAAANTVAVGSAAKPVTNIFLGTVANQAASFDTSSLSTNRTIKLPDAATVLPQGIAAVSHNFLTALNASTGAFTAAQPTLADIAAGIAPSGTFDFSGVTIFKGRFSAGLTTSVNGDFGYDTTNKNWHFWTNGADKTAAIWSATPTTGNCTQSSVAASVVLLADAGAPCGTWTNSSTSTGTNKTVDQEGSGNVITTVATGWLRAAGCNSASPAPSFDLPTTNAPSPNCLTGSNVTKATLDYDDLVNESAQFDIGLPHTWVGNIDINLKWLVIASGGSNAVKWTVATACSADGATYDTAFNAAQTITTNVAANNLQTVSSQTSITTTGCAADNVLNVKIGRDTTDTFTGTARLIAAQLIYRHTGK